MLYLASPDPDLLVSPRLRIQAIPTTIVPCEQSCGRSIVILINNYGSLVLGLSHTFHMQRSCVLQHGSHLNAPAAVSEISAVKPGLPLAVEL